MRKIFIVLACVITLHTIYAQSPDAFKYQAVVRKSDGTVVDNTKVGIRISIVKGNANGEVVFSEEHNAVSNSFGIINLNIGQGTILIGFFTQIEWSSDNYYIKMEIDENGGNSYTLVSTSQLLSVPYALYSKKTQSVEWNNIQNKPPVFDGNYNSLANAPDLSKFVTYELDPTFESSVAKGITASDTSRWGKTGSFSGNYNDLLNKPVLFDGSYSNLSNKPELSSVASTGSYNDLVEKPDLSIYKITENDPFYSSSVASGITQADTANWNKNIDFSGNYIDLINKPLLFNGSYQALLNKPSLKDSVMAILDTTQKFVKHPDSLSMGDMMYFDGFKWVKLAKGQNGEILELKQGIPKWGKKHYIGELYEGGVIFYVDESGQHGLICNMVDINSNFTWSNEINVMIGAGAQSTWNGEVNSSAIIAQSTHTASAALLCQDYINENYGTGVYTDWYLPSFDELALLFHSKYQVNKTIETDNNAATIPVSLNWYWTSTESDGKYAWAWCMYTGYVTSQKKSTTAYVRSIRGF